jgi:hypothetical protein
MSGGSPPAHVSEGKPPQAGRPAPHSFAAWGGTVFFEPSRLRLPLPIYQKHCARAASSSTAPPVMLVDAIALATWKRREAPRVGSINGVMVLIHPCVEDFGHPQRVSLVSLLPPT